MIKVFGAPKTRAMRVLWLAEELQLPVELHPIDPAKGEHRNPDFWRLNPFGKVPCIEQDGYALAESAAICTWLADQHPAKALIPKSGTQARGTHDQWMYFVMTEMEALLWMLFKNRVVLPEAERVPEIIPQMERAFAASLQIFAAHMQARSFVLGDIFQVVDIFMVSNINWALRMSLPMDRVLLDYRKRLMDRPAFQSYLSTYT